MPSVQLDTTTNAVTISHGRNIEVAGARLYALITDDGTLVYRYSDDGGATWSAAVTVSALEAYGSLVYDSVNARLNIVYAGGNSVSQALRFRAITTNVATGVPGALTTETVIDAGGGNLGVNYPFMLHSATATNPRYWIIAQKMTAAATFETRAWYATAGVSADTAGNWVTTNFTNLATTADATTSQHNGLGAWWQVGGAEKVTFCFGTGYASDVESVTFDPTAATPTPGAATVVGTLAGGINWAANGAPLAIGAKADYLVFGRLDATTGTWTFFKTVNGTTWSTPSGWASLTIGRCQIALSSGDFFLLHTDSYGVMATSAQALKYRKITAATDTMGSTTAFSDTNGNGVSAPRDTGTSNLYGLYRGSTASPYSVRSDFVALGGGGDVTPPGQAAVTVDVIDDQSVFLLALMPSDPDVSQYEVRYLTGATAPASGRTNGTISTAATNVAPNATVTPSITGLTAGVQISGRVFVKDAIGNWNTGQSFTAVPVTTPAFIGRFKIDGTTVVADGLTPGTDIFVWQLSTSNFLTGGANAHAELRVGSQSGTPPTGGTYDILSTAGTSVWQYENAALVWTNWPTAGLASTEWARRIRCNVDTNQSSQFGSLRVKNG